MKSNLNGIVLLAVVAAAFSAVADGLREDEVCFSSDAQLVEVRKSIDLRKCWPVTTAEEIELPYSAVGWDVSPQSAGASVRLGLVGGAFSDGAFEPGSDARDLATGLTGTGAYKWNPGDVAKKVYRVQHWTTRNEDFVESDSFCAYFDFTGLEQTTEAMLCDAVLGVTQPVAVADDQTHPWSLAGGDGLLNDADGATLAFTFRGAGVFSAELRFASGTVTVAVDGETVGTVPATAAWTACSWPVADYGTHTVTLTYGGPAEIGVRRCAVTGGTEDEIALCEKTVSCDLSVAFPVPSLENEPALQGLTYSAIGWEPDAAPDATRTVAITARSGTLADGVFSSDGGAELTVLAETTGKGTFDWHPTGLSKKLYQLSHMVYKNGAPDGEAQLYGYLDFTQCGAIVASKADVEAAVLDVSLPVSVTNDPSHPWSLIGGVGEGVCNDADGATLAFAFTGAGVFAAELRFASGTVTVAVDGVTVGTIPAVAEWTGFSWPVADYAEHVLTLTSGGMGEVGVRKCLFTDKGQSTFASGETAVAPVDLRVAFPVANLVDEPALKGLAYSAIGWERDAAPDATRTVTVTAQSGTMTDGVFVSDGGAAMTVLAATTGRGSFDWQLASVSKKVYRLSHAVVKNGSADGAAQLYGYLDFTHCAGPASEADVETAALAEITHEISVGQDARNPWQPIEVSEARSGLATDLTLEPGSVTTTTFAFRGRGVLHYEYDLTGGTLTVSADGEVVSTLVEPTSDWVPQQLTFEDDSVHVAAFAYTVDGGAMAAVRNVRWEERPESARLVGEGAIVRVDFQEGVRRPRRLADVLPFAYSSTNWIGGVVNVSAESVARVTIVELTGADPDVRNWAEEVPGTFKELVKRPGEATVRWRPRTGVWKAAFDILNDEDGIYRETALFDLRNARGAGFVLNIR